MKTRFHYIRNTARVVGLISCVFYIFISVKGGLSQVIQGRGDNLIPFFPYLAVAIAGYMIAYVKERKGGYIMLAGGVALFIFFLIYSRGDDWARAIVYGLPFILCGSAFIYCNDNEIE